MGVTGVLLGYPLPAGEGAPAPHASLGTKETDADAEASEAAHEHDPDPSAPYKAKVRTAHDATEARAQLDATPEALRQEVWPTYTDKLKNLGKAMGKHKKP